MPTSNYSRLLRHLQTWKGVPTGVLVYVDLRHMRTVNRLSGSRGGDSVIEAAKQVLADWAGPDGVSERVWSNEFVAVKPIDHGQAAIDEVGELRERLGQVHYRSVLGVDHVAVSIGLAPVSAMPDWPALLASAADACQRAKRRGLYQIVSCNALEPGARATQASAANVLEFRRLVQEDRLTLHAQPVMSLHGPTPRLRKAEFLLRMHVDGRDASLPPGMIESIEYFGLADELDGFTAQQVLDWIVDHGSDLARLDSVSLNLSAKSIVDGRFMDRLLRDVHALRIPRGKLCIEITETAAIEHLAVAAEVIDAFHGIGCRFALDDFGSGLCSFGYLQSLPVDEIKIDGRFIRDIAVNPVSREIVQAIHQVARATGKQTIAEFVDDPHKLAVLRSIGVDFAQGWLFHPALPSERFLELLRGHEPPVALAASS